MATGVELIAAERERQQSVEGWTAEHDDEHERGELVAAAACYLAEGAVVDLEIRPQWPWTAPGKPDPDPIRNLAKAGALIAAEIDRLQRAALPAAEREPTT